MAFNNLLSSCKQDNASGEQTHNSEILQISNLLDSVQHYQNINKSKTESFATQALFLSKNIRYNKGIAHSSFVLANTLSDFDSDLSESYILESMDLAKQLNDSILIARLYNLIGKIKGKSGDSKKSLNYYELALGIFLRHEQDSLAAGTYNNIGVEYDNIGNKSLAKSYFLKAIEINKKTNNIFWLSINYMNMGVRLAQVGENKEALYYAKKSQAICETYKYNNLLPYVYNNFFMIFTNLGDTERAKHNAYKALQYSMIINDIYIKFTITEAMSQYYKSHGKIDSAYHFQTNAMMLKDSIVQSEKAMGIELMEVKHDHQQELLLNKIKQEKKQNTYLMVTFGLILLASLSTILYLLQRSSFRKKQHEYEKLNSEKLIMQKEIDIKNRELACNMIHITDKNQLINKVIVTLSESNMEQKEELNLSYKKLISELNFHRGKNLWDGFDKEFSQIHPDFYKNISHDFPTLSQNDMRLCAFIRINMSSKEICDLLHLNYDSIFKARTRLRKKMNLTGSDEKLMAVISKY